MSSNSRCDAGYEVLNQHESEIPANGKGNLTNTIERLVQLYQGTGRSDQADERKKKLAVRAASE